MNILYAGDGEKEGAARYLLSVLKYLNAKVTHVHPKKILFPSLLKRKFDVIILSDFPYKNLPPSSEEIIVKQIQNGSGLWMIGGWSSYRGQNGDWGGSKIEELLPVQCLKKDDRVNFLLGAWPCKVSNHMILKKLSFVKPPVLCGMNQVKLKKGAQILLVAKEGVKFSSESISLSKKEYPLLAVYENGNIRTVALTTDLAPHWCGGMVDWGKKRRTLLWSKSICVEVGDQYVQFISSVVHWLKRSR